MRCSSTPHSWPSSACRCCGVQALCAGGALAPCCCCSCSCLPTLYCSSQSASAASITRLLLRTLGLLLAAGGGYAVWAQLPLEQALNGFISVLVFNIVYDLLIS